MERNLILGGIYSVGIFENKYFIYIGKQNQYRFKFIEIYSESNTFKVISEGVQSLIEYCRYKNEEISNVTIDKNLFFDHYDGYLGQIDSSLIQQLNHLHNF